MTAPESGGPVAIETRITEAAIDGLDPFAGSATSDGAVIVFQGRVRDSNEGREVRGLEYEAYREMAEKELRAICEEAAERFAVGAISAAHRVGRLELGEASVTIGVAAPHRAPCYDASRFIIEELKKRLPVWKHERYADGESEWVGAPGATATGAAPPGSGGAA
jgi:molybdopterin synthase catalytic subunit